MDAPYYNGGDDRDFDPRDPDSDSWEEPPDWWESPHVDAEWLRHLELVTQVRPAHADVIGWVTLRERLASTLYRIARGPL